MKGKKILGLLCLSAAMLLASCGSSTPTPTSSEVPPTSSEVPPTPSTSEVPPAPSSETESDSESKPEEITHREGLNKTLAEGAITRTYDERFDTIVEDFSGETLLGTTDGESHDGYLREVVDSNLGSFQNSPGAAIFKMASSTFDGDKTLIGQSTINIKMRVAEGKLTLKDLILGIRPGNDNDANVYPISLADAVDGDQEKLPELTNEYQTLSISVSESIGDEDTVFPGTELKVLSSALGFHLYVKSGSNVSAVVEIAEVSYSKGDSTVVIDDFKREKIAGNDRVYWGPTDCADAVLVRKGVKLSDGKKYTTPVLSDKQKGYTHVVIDALGDLTGASVEVTYDDTASTVKSLPFASLKAQGDNGVANAVNGAYSPLAVDLTAFAGPEGAKAKTITIKNTGAKELQIANIFMTSFEEPRLDKKYPHLNTDTAVTFDNFERNIASLDADWTKSAADERNVNAGINGFVSYSNGENISTSDGALHLPATDNYDEVTIGSSHVLKDAQYIVFSIKGEEGFDLSNFRFKLTDTGSEIWFNSAMAMEGVKTYGDAAISSPYVTDAGYTWYVVDLNYHNATAADLIHMYYTGTKAISISSIFYANSFAALDGRPSENVKTGEIDLADYAWVGNVGPFVKSRYLGFTVKGDGVATLKSFRVELNGSTVWIKDGNLSVCNSLGSKVTGDEVIPTDDTTYYVDLAGDNFGATGDGWTHLHVGGLEGATGKVTFSRLFMADAGVGAEAVSGANVTCEAGGYGYLGGYTAATHVDWFEVSVGGNEVSDLSQFRIEVVPAGGASTIYYAKDHPGMLKDVYGNALDLTTKAKDYVGFALDLSVLSISLEKGDTVHFHHSCDTAGWNVKFSAWAISEEVPYETALSSYVEAWAA